MAKSNVSQGQTAITSAGLPFNTPDYLNAEEVMRRNAPQLQISKPKIHTTSNEAKSKVFYKGTTGKWDMFTEDVLSWNYEKIRNKFALCADIPMWPDSAFEDEHPLSVTAEVKRNGCEMSMSGAFFYNNLKPVTFASEILEFTDKLRARTYKLEEHQRKAFGDAWTPGKQEFSDPDDDRKKPDVVLQVLLPEVKTRAVGELKFSVTTDLVDIILNSGDTTKYKNPKKGAQKWRRVMGQIVDYMVMNRTRYGFVSNYDSTVFLKIMDSRKGQQHPRVYYSQPIYHTEKVEEIGGAPSRKVSTRLAMLYMTEMATTVANNDWELSHEHYKQLKKVLGDEPEDISGLVDGTPFSRRTGQDLSIGDFDDGTPTRRLPLKTNQKGAAILDRLASLGIDNPKDRNGHSEGL